MSGRDLDLDQVINRLDFLLSFERSREGSWMPYPSILTISDGAPESRAALDLAVSLGHRWSAHLDVVCLGVDRTPTGFYNVELAHQIISDLFREAMCDAEKNAKSVRELVTNSEPSVTVRTAAARFSELQSIIGEAAWFQDLVVLPAPFGRKDEELSEAILDAALFGATTPVLVAPQETTDQIGKRILVAWNGAAESTRALRAALPLLRAADTVEATMIEDSALRIGNSEPCFALGAMLSRHGVNATTSHLPNSAANIAETLCVRATEIDADMIVMGAYGHSRFRERMIGGATRDMLKQVDRPVFFAR